MSEERKIIAVSGGFDPVHVGHIQMIEEAAEHGDVLIIINSDDWLLRKKGYVFMPWSERAYIMKQIKGVIKVVPVDDSDDSVCEALQVHKPDCFANGGDRRKTNTPEMNVCEELGIALMWNVGGGKIQSSSDLVNKAKWGKMVINGQEI
jgi:cytidyltransferase-like protein